MTSDDAYYDHSRDCDVVSSGVDNSGEAGNDCENVAGSADDSDACYNACSDGDSGSEKDNCSHSPDRQSRDLSVHVAR